MAFAQTATSSAAVASPTQAVPLASLGRGRAGVITEWRLDADDAALLKAMGLCTGSSVTVVRTGQPCVVAITGGGDGCACGGMCRIGLARGLAERVMVVPEMPTA